MSKKHRLPPTLVPVENGTKKFIPLEHARRHEKNGRGFFQSNGMFRFILSLTDIQLRDEQQSTTQCEWHVRKSVGFEVLQAEMAQASP